MLHTETFHSASLFSPVYVAHEIVCMPPVCNHALDCVFPTDVDLIVSGLLITALPHISNCNIPFLIGPLT